MSFYSQIEMYCEKILFENQVLFYEIFCRSILIEYKMCISNLRSEDKFEIDILFKGNSLLDFI